MQVVKGKAKRTVLQWARRCRLTLLGCLALTYGVLAQSISKEYQVKAAFVYNFTQFVEWPESAFSDPNSPFIIGIIGKDPFGGFIDELVLNESIGTHPLTVVRYPSLEAIENCHILFINLRNPTDIERAVNMVADKAVLTVSDANEFTRMGGMIGLRNGEGRIRLRINVAPIEKSNLKISSKLLRLAEVVDSQSN